VRARWVFALVAGLVAMGLAACSSAAAPLEKMSVGITNRPFAALVVIADQQGLFAAHGLDVDVRKYPTGPAAIKDMLAGTIDVCMSADFGYANTSFSDDDFAVVCGIAHDVDHQILTRKGSGIATPSDLTGKRVGVLKGAAQFPFMLARLLEESGVASSAVRVMEFESDAIAQALIDGQADAIVTWRPISTADRPVLDGRVELMPMAGVGDTWSLLAVRPGTIAGRSDAVNGLLAALVDAQSWAEQHPDAAVQTTRTFFGQQDAYPEGWPAEALYVDLSQTAVVRLEEEAKWIASTTGRTPIAPIRSLVDGGPLGSIDPDRVTILGP
jgi:ABC-type nitrate/sulfonate/bicarbonate transport system substrate-binding protein